VRRLIAWAAFACAVLVAPALAQELTLRALSGGFAVTGDLQGFDGDYWRLTTPEGPVTLRAAKVRCEGADCPEPGQTTGFSISAATGPGAVLVPALIRAYGAARGYGVAQEAQDAGHQRFWLQAATGTSRRFPIDLRRIGAAEVFADLAASVADMGISDRSVNEAELAILRDAGLGDLHAPDQELLLALDALVPAVNPQRALRRVSFRDLSAALSDAQSGWGALSPDAPAEPLTLALRANGADLERLQAQLPGIASPLAYFADGAAVSQAVQADPGRLGLLARSELGGARALRLQETCGLGHGANAAELALGGYPWMIPIKAYVPARRLPREMADFLAFLQTEAAAGVMRRAGVVRPSATPVEVPLAQRALVGLRLADDPAQLAALRGMTTALEGATPLAISVPGRGQTGPLRGLRRLALGALGRALALQEIPPERLLFVASAADRPRALALISDMRADLAPLLPDALAGRLQSVPVLLDGALLPMACPGAPWAGWMNTRVDVWLRPATDTPLREN